MFSRSEFLNWLRQNEQHFREGDYAPDQIASLALNCGFKLEDICPGVCDRLAYLTRLIKFLNSPFATKWKLAERAQNGRDNAHA